MFLLDTNVLSELRKQTKANRNVAAWAEGRNPSDLFLSVITLFEVELGARRIARRDPAAASHLRDWIDNFVLITFSSRLLPVDTDVALRCAALHVPNPKPDRDALIAATALVHGLTVVTRNVRDFRDTGVLSLDPWEGT